MFSTNLLKKITFIKFLRRKNMHGRRFWNGLGAYRFINICCRINHSIIGTALYGFNTSRIARIKKLEKISIMNKLSKNRKAQMSFVVKMILIIVSAIILFIAITAIFGMFISKGDIEACRLSVITQANSKIILSPTGDKSPFNINCDKYYINFFDNKVEGGYDPGKTKPIEVQYNGKKTKNIVLNDYVFNQVMAEELRKCWYMFGEGKIDVFDTSLSLKSIFGSNDVCFVCTEATIKPTVTQKEFNGLIDYLKTTNIEKQGISYFEYLNSAPDGKVDWETYLGLFDKSLYTYKADTTGDSKYMIIFAKQDKRLGQLFKNQLSTFGPFALAPPAVIYAAFKNIFSNDKAKNNNYFVMVIKDTELHNFCDVQAS
jgi:hypothetical protein